MENVFKNDQIKYENNIFFKAPPYQRIIYIDIAKL